MIDAAINGVSFRSLNLGLIRHDIPVLPPTKDYSLEVSGRDGELDFGCQYGARVISLECILMADNPTTDYQLKVARIARAFHAQKGDQAFTFADRPGKRYMARYSGTMPIEKIIFDGRLTIPLKMHDPWPESDERVFESTLIKNAEVVSIESVGDVKSQPIITLTNTGTNTIRGFTITNEFKLGS